MEVIYLDNAASTWPKPHRVKEAMVECLDQYAANPGRGSHQMAIQAAKVITEARKNLAELFMIRNPLDIAFFSNATTALNQGIIGLLNEGDHVVTTALEHNSVRRPLEFLRRTKGVTVSYVAPRLDYSFYPSDFAAEMTAATKLVVVSHASNVTGMIVPVEEIGRIAREKGIPFMVDASQTAGCIPIDVEKMGIDLLAFPGHKGLYGPQGTGGLYIHPRLDLLPLYYGGTGNQSERVDQPDTRPYRYESGTLNTVGIAGLAAGIRFVLETGVEKIRERELRLTRLCLEELERIEGVTLIGPPRQTERVGVVSFSLQGVEPEELAHILDREFNIAVRAGYHCSPLAHQTAGTFETGGTIRISFGFFNTEEDVQRLVLAIREISNAFT